MTRNFLDGGPSADSPWAEVRDLARAVTEVCCQTATMAYFQGDVTADYARDTRERLATLRSLTDALLAAVTAAGDTP